MIKKFSKTYKKIKSSKDGRVLVANFGYLSLLQIASYVFPLITIPYLARVIGVDSFGKIAFASAVIVWFNTVADWGFNYTATRDVAKNRDNVDKVSEIFSNVLWARLLLMLLSFVLLLIAIWFIPQFRENKLILLITFLSIPGNILFPDWFFQALERMKYITIFNLISKLLFTLLIFVFIKEKSDFILQPLFMTLGFTFSGVIAMYFILVRWKVKLKQPNFPVIIETIKSSTDVFINNIMPNFYNSFSIILLGFWGGPIANGLLDASRKFTTVTHQFVNIISRTFFPFLSRKIDKHTVFAQIYLTVAAFLSLFLFLFAPLLIKLFFTPEFYNSIHILRITSVSIFLIALSKVYGSNYMIIEGYERQLRNITIRSSLIGFCISFPLIYFFEFIGAAITITLTQAILGLCIANKALSIKRDITDNEANY